MAAAAAPGTDTPMPAHWGQLEEPTRGGRAAGHGLSSADSISDADSYAARVLTTQ